MIANWIHIVVVHIAVIGTPWLAYRVISQRSISLESGPWKANYTVLIVLALVSGISYYTGPESADHIKQVLSDFPQDHVEDHALWGRISLVIQVIAGLLGIMGWASILQEETPDRRIPMILMILLVVNTAVIFYTAHLGGLIRRMDLF